MREVIFEKLKSYTYIDKIQYIDDDSGVFLHKFKFEIHVNNTVFDISMEIPLDWECKMLKVSVDNFKELPFMPHFGEDGSLCLFELEGLLLGLSISQCVSDCIEKLQALLFECSTKSNSNDLIFEFESYWGLLPNSSILKSAIDTSSGSKPIYVFEPTPDKDKSRKSRGNKVKSIIKVKQKTNKFVSDKSNISFLQKMYPVNGQKSNGEFIVVNLEEYLYPPDWRRDLNIEYVNRLVEVGLGNSKTLTTISKSKSVYTIVFKIIQPNSESVLIGVSLKNVTFDAVNHKFISSKQSKIIPHIVVRADSDYLLERGGSYKRYDNLDVLVIGCGSIGGYLISNLLKSGIRNITVVDGDILTEDNIFRHQLGMQYVDKNKAIACKEFFERNIPYACITAIPENFEVGYDHALFDIDDFQLVVSAVGNHNFNMWLNKLMHRESIDVPVIYLWNEVLGVGSHAFLVSKNQVGCFECIIDHADGFKFDRSSYCKPGQKYTRQVQGCGSFYVPYNSLTSIKSANIGTELILKWCDGEIHENTIISEKGDCIAFINEGYQLSERYKKQIELRESISGRYIQREDCCLCKMKK